MKEQSKKKNKLIFFLKILFIIYVTVGICVYFFQDKILFHPEPLPADYLYKFKTAFTEINVHYDSSTKFNILRFSADSGRVKKGAVIYFHGNMDNINHYAMFADNFTSHGYEVWMMDYPRFGKSTGGLNEKMLYTEALEVYKMVRAAGYSADSIIIYGKSLGTGIAAQLAGIRDCKRLILEAPYYSIEYMASSYFWMYPLGWMMKTKIPTYEYLPKVTAPITIFHGTDDDTISLNNAEKLKLLFKQGDELITITGGHHNDLNDFPLMKEKLDSLLNL